jgi:ATP-dependent Lon protease
MEVIRISGYTEDEKIEIARRHLIPKQMKAHALKKDEFVIADSALSDLIRYYTREAGVRNLERELAGLARKATREILQKKLTRLRISSKNLDKYAGVRRFRYGEIELEDMVGVVTGLAWTEVGGELLTVESVVLPGKGNIKYTGKLGDVMQESIQAAASFVRARSAAYGIKPTLFEKRDIHVHVPEGATPKDGPSAGLAMFTSIVSVLTKIPVRRDIAMTGEITLRGRVLPIGGLKEKLLAALRGGIKTVLIPRDNEKDLAEIPDNVKKGLKIISVATVDDVVEHALAHRPVAIEWTEADEAESKPLEPGKEPASNVVTH